MKLLHTRCLTVLILAVASACAGPSPAQKVAVPSAEQRISEHVYSIQSRDPLRTQTLAYLVRRASQLTLAAGFGHFAVARVGTNDASLQLVIFMYNDEREIPLELIDAETFDANEYKDKAYVPLGIFPGAS